MKKAISLCLVICLAFSLMAVTALAAPPDEGIYDEAVESAYSGVVTLDNQTDKLVVTYTGAAADKNYLVLAMTDESGIPTSGNLVYIDQTASTGTSVSFTVYPSELKAGTTYYVYLASNATEGIGTMAKVASFKYYVPYKLGDVDEDGTVTSSDALTVLQAVVGTVTLTENQKLAANVDGDSDVTSSDALYLLQVVVGQKTLG